MNRVLAVLAMAILGGCATSVSNRAVFARTPSETVRVHAQEDVAIDALAGMLEHENEASVDRHARTATYIVPNTSKSLIAWRAEASSTVVEFRSTNAWGDEDPFDWGGRLGKQYRDTLERKHISFERVK